MLAEDLRPEARALHTALLARADAPTRRRLDEAVLAQADAVRAEGILRLAAPLNPEQLAALLHDHAQDGPLLILAGAGSGKTAVLTRRVVYLLLQGVPASAICTVTFTNKAAGEMRERVQHLLTELRHTLPAGGAALIDPLLPAAAAMWLGTFHSVCLRLLRDQLPGSPQTNIERCGYKSDFRLMEPLQARALIEQAMAETGPAALAVGLETMQGLIEQAHTDLRDAAALQAAATDSDRLTGAVLQRYQELKRARRLLDFSDIITCAVTLLQQDAEVAAHYRARFAYALIDEYQDTNFAQYVFARQLTKGTDNIFVVGDDDQSIYAWRGADIRNILLFREDYPSARIIKLVRNYRSSRTIIAAANSVFRRHKPAELRKELEAVRTGADGQVLEGEKIALFTAGDEADEAAFCVFVVQRELRAGRPAGECAMFYRTNAQARPLKDALTAAGIPYLEYGDRRFFALREVDNTLAWLRLTVTVARLRQQGAEQMEDAVLDEANRCLETLFGIPVFGFTEEERALLLGSSGAWRTLTDDEQYGMVMARLPAEGRRRLDAFIDRFYRVLGIMHGGDLATGLEQAWQALGYAAPAAAADQKGRALQRHLDLFRHLHGQWAARETDAVFPDGSARLAAFLAALDEQRRDPQATVGAGGDAVLLMTLHAAKGLEFPVVCFTGLDDGICPFAHCSDRDLDEAGRQQRFGEELRLFYVGLTRAQERLFLTRARQRTRNGRSVPCEPSPFLKLLPAHTVTRGDARGSLLGRLREKAGALWGS